MEGGLDILHVPSKIKACEIENIPVLTSLEFSMEFWHIHAYALYQLGPTIKWNPKLFSNNMPHRDQLPKIWKENFRIANRLKWKTEEWQEATHKYIYTEIKKLHETSSNNPTEKIPWGKTSNP